LPIAIGARRGGADPEAGRDRAAVVEAQPIGCRAGDRRHGRGERDGARHRGGWAALSDLRRHRCGRIVNIASTEALGATSGLLPYTATKHGVVGLTIRNA
jgi:NAD(P)-dependent dehydrogenase (short-subunit alcohol dehydrogenase family)